MISKSLAKTEPGWLKTEGTYPETVVWSGVEIARSLAEKKFWPTAGIGKAGQRRTVARAVKLVLGEHQQLRPGKEDAIVKGMIREKFPWLKAATKEASGLISITDQTLQISAGPAESLRIYSYSGGMLPESAFYAALDTAESMGQVLEFAFDPELGFLNPDLEYVGSGMGFKALLHLPGLVHTEELAFWKQNMEKAGMSCVGLHRGWPRPWGNLITVNYKPGPGVPPVQGYEAFRQLLVLSVEIEKDAREMLSSSVWEVVQDKVLRSWATARAAVLVPIRELLEMLSWIRLGISLDILEPISMKKLNKLLFMSGRSHIKAIGGTQINDIQEDYIRASFVRSVL